MIPDGWKRKYLGEVITLQRGFDLPEQDRIHGTIPIISSSGITGFHNESKVSPPGIVTGRYGTIGKVFLVDVDFWPLNTSLWVKDFYGNDHRYVYYLLQGIDYKKLSDKTGVPGINRNDVYKLRVLLPPLLEQCKIAEMLGAWDESIDLLERLIGKKRSRKQGLMQQLLTGKKRFKEFEGNEWKKVSIGEIAFVDKRSLNNSTPKDYTFFYISLSDIDNGHMSNDLEEICFEQAPSRARRLVSNNDILMATVRPNLKSFAIVKTDADKYVASTGFAVITAKKYYSSDYLYQYIYSNHIEKQIEALVTGSNYPAINSTEIKNLSVYCPPLPEQKKIAAVLSAADEEISTLEKQLAAYKQQKLGLMQQLLTGRIRI